MRPQYETCRALWCAVILRAVQDACEPYSRLARRRKAFLAEGDERIFTAKCNGASQSQINGLKGQIMRDYNKLRLMRLSEELSAERWILSESRDKPNSFINICEAIGLDAEAIRTKVITGSAQKFLMERSERRGSDKEAA